MLIVHLDVTLSDFVGQENILVEHRAHCARALVNATPSFDIACFGLRITNNHVYWPLPDD